MCTVVVVVQHMIGSSRVRVDSGWRRRRRWRRRTRRSHRGGWREDEERVRATRADDDDDDDDSADDDADDDDSDDDDADNNDADELRLCALMVLLLPPFVILWERWRCAAARGGAYKQVGGGCRGEGAASPFAGRSIFPRTNVDVG